VRELDRVTSNAIAVASSSSSSSSSYSSYSSSSSSTSSSSYSYFSSYFELLIYTDGSRMDNKAGLGWAACFGDQVIFEDHERLGDATVFQAEVLAIHSAARWLRFLRKDFNEVTFLSDSQSALMALKNSETTSILVHECRLELNRLSRTWFVRLGWTKGHADTTGNELADSIAKQGTEGFPMGPTPWLPVALPPLKLKVGKIYESIWTARWAAETTCRQTRLLQPSPAGPAQYCFLTTLPKKSLKQMVDFITGHCLLMRHAHLIDNSIDPLCRTVQRGRRKLLSTFC
jgi:ribonuclease HI